MLEGLPHWTYLLSEDGQFARIAAGVHDQLHQFCYEVRQKSGVTEDTLWFVGSEPIAVSLLGLGEDGVGPGQHQLRGLPGTQRQLSGQPRQDLPVVRQSPGWEEQGVQSKS